MWINHLFPVCWFYSGHLVWNINGFWKFGIMENKYFIVCNYVCLYIYLHISQCEKCMMIPYFHSPYFHISINFLESFLALLCYIYIIFMLFSCDQAALWMLFSVRLSVCPSVTPLWLCSHHRIIMKFSGVITKDQGKVHAKGQGQKSKVKVTEVMTQLNCFGTVTPVCIHIWWWNDTYSLMLLWRGALLFFKVIRQVSRSHDAQNCRIWTRLGISGL